MYWVPRLKGRRHFDFLAAQKTTAEAAAVQHEAADDGVVDDEEIVLQGDRVASDLGVLGLKANPT